jgi:hypothetical protein
VDGGEHWHVQDEGWADEQWAFDIYFDPRDANTMYACSLNGENKGAGRDGLQGTVMKSINGGLTTLKTWRRPIRGSRRNCRRSGAAPASRVCMVRPGEARSFLLELACFRPIRRPLTWHLNPDLLDLPVHSVLGQLVG